MKYVKWAALILIALAIVAAVVQWRRDSIALEIANRVLKDTDFVVESISVRKVGVEHIELSSIVLETPGGSHYDVVGVSYPLTARDPRRITIESLTAVSFGEQSQTTSYIALARAFLALPDTLVNTDVRVQQVSVRSLPELSGIGWTTSGSGQTFAAEVAGLAVTGTVAKLADDAHEVRVTASDAMGTTALRGTLAVTDRERRFGIDGDIHLDLAAIEPLVRALGWVPLPAEAMTATVDALIVVDLDVEKAGHLAIRLGPTLSKGSSLTWRGTDGLRVDLTLDADTRLDVVLAYPSLLWTLDAEGLRGRLLLDGDNAIVTALSDVRCRAGVRCTLGAIAHGKGLAWGDVGIRAVDARASSDIVLTLDDSGWSAEVERVEIAVEDLRPTQQIATTLNFVVSDLQVVDSFASVEARFRASSGGGRLRYGDFEFAVPRMEGTVRRAGNSLTSSLRLIDGLRAHIDLSYDIAGESGNARIRDGVADFSRRKLSERIIGWSYPWDVIAGTWTVSAELDWATAPAGLRYRGRSTHRIEGLAGVYNDIGMAGLATTLQADLDSKAPLAIRPTTLTVDLIDVGLPIEELTATVTPDLSGLAIRIDDLSGSVLGGRFRVDPFTYRFVAERNDMQVHLERIQPQFMVDLAKFEQLKVTGTMSGVLPLTLLENTIRIEGGAMTSDPPGGVIRYAGSGGGAGSNEQLAMVTGALSNFVYDSLSADVDYTKTGDLRLGMRLEGVNPDRDSTQPIILNLNVDNNIPQMLRSLQAVRSIEDILESRTAN